MHSLFREPAEAAVQMKTWHTLRIQQQSLGDQPLSQEVVSSPGAVVDELSQNFILQQAAYMEGPQDSSARLPKKAEYAICRLEGLEFPSSALTLKAMGKPAPTQHSSQTLDKSPGWSGPLGLAHG